MNDHHHDHHSDNNITPDQSILDPTISTIASSFINALNLTNETIPMHDHDHSQMHHNHSDMNISLIGMQADHGIHNHVAHDSSGHAMAFHFGHRQVLFFDAWNINTPLTLIYACIGIFVFSVLYEGLKVFREHLMAHPPFASLLSSTRGKLAHNGHKKKCCAGRAIITDLDDRASAYAKMNESSTTVLPQFSMGERGGFKSCDCRKSPKFSILDHGLQSILHIIQTGLGFMLMLIFMTFNVWMCLALLLGAGFGYFCFAWKRKIAIVDVTQHCN